MEAQMYLPAYMREVAQSGNLNHNQHANHVELLADFAKKPARKAKGEGVKAPTRTLNEDGRATDGKPINPGDVFATLSGRQTTAYPKQKGERYASRWLIENALAEAQARGDDFNAHIFGNTKPLKDGTLTTTDRESMLMYLFGQQPAVAPSILKPLAPKPEQAIDREKLDKDFRAFSTLTTAGREDMGITSALLERSSACRQNFVV